MYGTSTKSGKKISEVLDSSISRNIPIPRIYPKSKRCERSNYVPHPTPSYTNKSEWAQAYTPQLREMYRIIRMMTLLRFPKAKIEWGHPRYHAALVKLMYHCSSKYISPHIDYETELKVSKKEDYDNKGWERQGRN